MNDSNPFEDFVNGLDLPEPNGDEAIPIPADDAEAAADQMAQRIHSVVQATIKRASEQPTEKWDQHLNVFQLFVRNDLLNCAAPRPGALDGMTKEEVAMNAGYTLITLAWMIYNEVASTLMPPYEEADF